jgi:hypothetical protein
MQSALDATNEQARTAIYGEPGTDERWRADTAQRVHNALNDYMGGVQALQPQSASDLAYYVPGVGNALSARDAYNALSDRDYGRAVASGVGAVPLVGGIFAGAGARTANLAKLSQAGKMMEAGHAPEDIWRKTGWFKGADDKWRFEIPDNNLVLAFGGNAPLNVGVDHVFNGITHPELANAYSDLYGSVLGGYGKSWPHPGGSFDPVTRDIESYGPDFLEAKKGVIHELQHAAQEREGFSGGSNWRMFTPDQIAAERDAMAERANNIGLGAYFRSPSDEEIAYSLYNRHAGEVEARNAENRALFSPRTRAQTPPWETQDIPYEQQILGLK